MKLTNEKVMKLSVPILCALIERGIMPFSLAGSPETLRAMIADHLDTVAQAVKMAYVEMEKKDEDQGDIDIAS